MVIRGKGLLPWTAIVKKEEDRVVTLDWILFLNFGLLPWIAIKNKILGSYLALQFKKISGLYSVA